MVIHKYISQNTAILAGFNEDASICANYGKKQARIYLGGEENYFTIDKSFNIAIIEQVTTAKGKRKKEFYFGTFTGRPISEARNPAEIYNFNREIDKIWKRKNRTKVRDLEKKLLDIIESQRIMPIAGPTAMEY